MIGFAKSLLIGAVSLALWMFILAAAIVVFNI